MRRPRWRVLAVLLTAVLAVPAPLAGQSELVVIKTGEKEKVYHRAGCPSLEGVKDVLALPRAKASARGLEQHDLCDPAKSKAGASGKHEPITVFVDSSKYYHKKDCPKLEKDAEKADLEAAGKKLWPCPTCRPPIRKRKGSG